MYCTSAGTNKSTSREWISFVGFFFCIYTDTIPDTQHAHTGLPRLSRQANCCAVAEYSRPPWRIGGARPRRHRHHHRSATDFGFLPYWRGWQDETARYALSWSRARGSGVALQHTATHCNTTATHCDITKLRDMLYVDLGLEAHVRWRYIRMYVQSYICIHIFNMYMNMHDIYMYAHISARCALHFGFWLEAQVRWRYLRISIHICTHIYLYVYKYSSMCIYSYMCIYAFTHICTYIFLCI